MILKIKFKKIFKTAAAAFLICILLSLLINIFMILSTGKRILSIDNFNDSYDFIIVLGCGIVDNKYPTDLMADRLDTALKLYEQGAAHKILMSGDHRYDDYNEVSVMRNYVVERGVPEKDVLSDDLGLSTFETMQRASRIYDINSAVIVTQKYHLYRSLYNADHFDIDCKGVIAAGHTYMGQPYYSAREFLARVKDFIYCIVF